MAKTMTLRLNAEQAAELDAIARVDEVPVAEAVRQAIDDRIKTRRNDKKFQDRLRRIIDEDRQILERLAR
jgi:hypothetical protein